MVSVRAPVVLVLVGCLAALAIGCGPPGSGTTCQSGPKYGTKCYSTTDLQNPPGQRPTPPDDGKGDQRR